MSQTVDIRELNERIESKSSFVNMITMGMDQVIVGQKHLVESLLIGLLSDGHILLEGVPGLAKTLAIKTLASLIDAKYSRIQFTQDLLPAKNSKSNKVQSSLILYWRMKSTVLRQRCRVPFWKQCRNAR